jgi:hypothetical protein
MSTPRAAPPRGARSSRRPVGAAVLALVLSFAAAPRAEAYVRYKTKSGKGFFWPQTCIPLSAYPYSMADVSGNMEMTPDEILHAATAAAAAWGSARPSDADPVCTYLKINVTESDAKPPVAGLDYANILIFRTTSWCAPTDAPGTCSYQPEALAITSVFVNKVSGQILDGDIEVNSKNFVWTDLDLDPKGTGKQDLQNALTHEMGHLIGLDHTCFPPGTPGTPPLDDMGNPVPSCDTAPTAVQETTMFASAIPGDTAKRTLAPDDIRAVCDIYPVASDPMICPTKDSPPQQQACALAPGSSPGGAGAGAGLWVLAALLVAARRRGRRS